MKRHSGKLRYTAFFITLFCLSLSVRSQENMDFRTADQLTFRYYNEEKWDSLIYTGKLALENGIDYFYLRSRMGWAYFKQKNYARAAVQFENALRFNSGDNFAVENLYYSYLNLNRSLEATAVYDDHTEIFAGKIKENPVRELYYEAGSGTNRYDENEFSRFVFASRPPHAGPGWRDTAEWAETDRTYSYIFYGGGIKYKLFKNVQLTNYYTYLRFDHEKQVLIGNSILTDTYPLYQHQLYVKMQYNAWKGIQVIPAFHYIMVDYKTVYSSFNPPQKKVYLERKQNRLDNYAVSLAFEKRFTWLGLGLNGSWSNLNDSTQKQLGLTVHTWPFGNLNLWTSSSGVFRLGENSGFVGEQKLGGRLHRYVWADAAISVGNMRNFTEQNAFLINNMTEDIRLRYGLAVTVPIKNLHFSLKYQGSLRSDEIRFFNAGFRAKKSEFRNHVFIGFLTWKFK